MTFRLFSCSAADPFWAGSLQIGIISTDNTDKRSQKPRASEMESPGGREKHHRHDDLEPDEAREPSL
jgi:hypothetical protein